MPNQLFDHGTPRYICQTTHNAKISPVACSWGVLRGYLCTIICQMSLTPTSTVSPLAGACITPIIDLRVDTGNAMTPDYGHTVVIRFSVIGHSGGAVVCLYGYHLSIDLATDSATSGSSAGTSSVISSGEGTSCFSSSFNFLSSVTIFLLYHFQVYIITVILSAPITKGSWHFAQLTNFTKLSQPL